MSCLTELTALRDSIVAFSDGRSVSVESRLGHCNTLEFSGYIHPKTEVEKRTFNGVLICNAGTPEKVTSGLEVKLRDCLSRRTRDDDEMRATMRAEIMSEIREEQAAQFSPRETEPQDHATAEEMFGSTFG